MNETTWDMNIIIRIDPSSALIKHSNWKEIPSVPFIKLLQPLLISGQYLNTYQLKYKYKNI